MDIDTILTVLFIVVIVVFQVFGVAIKKVARQGAADEDKKMLKKGGFLDVVVKRIKEEIEAAKDAALTPPSPPPSSDQTTTGSVSKWASLMPEPQKPASPEPATRRPLSAFDASHETHAAKKETKPAPFQTGLQDLGRPLAAPKTSTPYKDTEEPAHPADFQPTPSPQKKRSPHHERILELRRAVIWAEVLAPPLALRNEKTNGKHLSL